MAARNFFVPGSHAFNSNGFAISGATATLYLSGTTTPAAFYSDGALTVSLGATITANAAGRFPSAYGDDAVDYRLILKNASGVELEDTDPFRFGQTLIALPIPPLSPDSYGAAGDGTTDDAVALASLATEDQGHVALIPSAKYRISTGLVFRGLVEIDGEGNGQNPGTVDGVSYPYPTNYSGSVIYSDANITALEFQPFTSETDVATVNGALAAHYTQQSAYGSKIADLSIISAGNGAAHANKHGLYSRTKIFASNLFIYGHGDDGFKIDASTQVDGHAYGNANGSLVLGLESSGNAGNGFSNGGADTNGSLFMGLIVSENDGWGIDDQSQIGSTYIGPVISANGDGSIRTADNSPVVILGGYIEPDSGKLADLGSLTMLLGGNAADEANHAADSPAFVLNGNTAHCQGLAGKNRLGSTDVMAGIGRDPSSTTGTAFWFGSNDDTAQMDAFRLTKDFQWVGVWTLSYAAGPQIEEYVTSDHAASALTNGYAKGFPNGIYMGTVQSAPRLCPAAAAMPATGSYRAGDIVANSTPAVGGILLWRRLTTGSAHVAGTDWEAVYALTGAVSDTAYDATTWNGSLDVPTKNAVRDKLEGALTPTSVAVGGGTALTKVVAYAPTLTPASVAAATIAEETFTVSGLTTADKVIVNPPAIANATGIAGARVSAADTLAIRFVNPTAGALTPSSGTYTVMAFRG